MASPAWATVGSSSVAGTSPPFHARESAPSGCTEGFMAAGGEESSRPASYPCSRSTRLRDWRAAPQEISFLSFFDEDDEPRTRVRPRRPASSRAGSTSPDRQTVLVRQLVLVGGSLLVLVLLFFVINGCRQSA